VRVTNAHISGPNLRPRTISVDLINLGVGPAVNIDVELVVDGVNYVRRGKDLRPA
jgi:hypothetical protein